MYVDTGSMTADEAKQVLDALQTKGVRLPCPRCGNKHFTLLEGYFNRPIASLTYGTATFTSGPTVPSVVTACSNCGFLSQHAPGVLRSQVQESLRYGS